MIITSFRFSLEYIRSRQTPNSKVNGNGDDGVALTISFTVINGFNINDFTLYNAVTDLPIGSLMDGDVIDLSVIGQDKLNITADADPVKVKSVKFGFNGNSNFKIENAAPFALGGDINQNFQNLLSFTPGTYMLSATPYSKTKGKGTAGATKSITFSVIDSGNGNKLKDNMGSLSIFPNPTKDNIVLSMEKGQVGTIDLKVMNVFGQVIIEKSFEAQASNWTHKLSLEKLPAGIYIVSVQSENGIISQQVFKQ